MVLARGGVDADGVLTNASLRRTLLGVTLYKDGLAPLLVFSGGISPDGLDEAAVRAALAGGLGIPPGAVLTASPVRSTRDEGAVVRRLLEPRGVRRILLVADPVDMPRTRAVFERVGFAVLPAPTASSGPSDPESRLQPVAGSRGRDARARLLPPRRPPIADPSPLPALRLIGERVRGAAQRFGTIIIDPIQRVAPPGLAPRRARAGAPRSCWARGRVRDSVGPTPPTHPTQASGSSSRPGTCPSTKIRCQIASWSRLQTSRVIPPPA